MARKGYFSWEVREGVKCASFLRRIYEEVSDVALEPHIYFEISDTLYMLLGYFQHYQHHLNV